MLLATFADEPAGCAAFRRLDAEACELLHVYVRNQYRGKRIARQMMEKLIPAAKNAGYSTMRLETTPFMKEARALYTSLGFQPCEPYRPIPRVFEPWTICMELLLNR